VIPGYLRELDEKCALLSYYATSVGNSLPTFRYNPGPPSPVYNGYRFSLPGVKRSGREVGHPPSHKNDVKERVMLIPLLPLRAFIACYRVKLTIIIA